jgi:membrane protease YdiL (CAAX protease family)
LKEIRSILFFLIGSALLGALLAPWLFWAGKGLATRGVAPFLAETDFAQFFDRAVLVAAVALLWPTIRALRIRSRAHLGIEPDLRGWSRLAVGFVAGFVCMAAFGVIVLQLGVYRLKVEPPWGDLARIAVSAFTVGVLEEWLFRGAMLGIFRRAMGQWSALACVSAIYSILHFVKPPRVEIPDAQIDWLTGFRVLPSCFEKFAEPALLGAGFTTLFLLGWILGWATIRTRSLWLSIGLHAGLVFAKFGFSKLTKRKLDDTMPWIGEDMIVGLGALTVVGLAGALCWAWLRLVEKRN